jgi:hypothetical protein
MAIEVVLHERDETTGVSRLTATHRAGRLETPHRLITRNDLNALSRVGVVAPLTLEQRAFVLERNLNPDSCTSILERTDYLATSVNEITGVLQRVDRTALKVVYVKFTEEAHRALPADGETRARLLAHVLELTQSVPASAFALPIDLLREAEWEILRRGQLPIIPVINIRSPRRFVEEGIARCEREGASLVPFVGLTFATYARATHGYQAVMSLKERIHERAKQGIIVFGAPRSLPDSSLTSGGISSPHYGSFLISDITGEVYHRGGSSDPRRVAKMFVSKELAVRQITPNSPLDGTEQESAIFQKDRELLGLFERTATGMNTTLDWERNRPSAVARLHEAFASSQEFSKMRRSIAHSELGHYLSQKKLLLAYIHRERGTQN